MSIHLSEQEILRRNSLRELREAGIDPYPAALYPVNINSKIINEQYKAGEHEFPEVMIAGRIMSRRIMGNASFCEIQDAEGRVQLYFKRDDICPGDDKSMYNVVFKKLLEDRKSVV